ncbi:envelope stress response protein PspG [Pectobacterium odoriferum]|uniref:Phage shock protein G n=1 Tax=Pectobacterium odoriferum TaxID=78398 RepID=A0ABD6VR09_9GAMM|nr:envelope stress response protein PspG [Pectobacterium odoriferum]AIU89657.1 phage-shock protein [Pectobacterium odoriferum]KGA37497.1 phage-shock protein [Pectobacterium odoriferum]KGA39568.1 phage-shock protein [Pectobacterium odoriferum]MBA0187588.1 envelope stress response protein PspG [Pectobacterium odoriferum]MCA6962913.1 envelope stress response protein PspG [Pectobacterium odoriferum]
MLEIFFVIGFFIMLMLTGVSLLGVIAALFVASLFMLVGGLFTLAIKVLPWLILAVAAVWLWRKFSGRPVYNSHRDTYRHYTDRKYTYRQRNRNEW